MAYYLQKKNPINEVKEKLNEQEIEIHLLKEIIVKGFKRIESLPSQSQATSEGSAITEADESETSKNETINDDVTNCIENTGPELPLPIPNLFHA